ncbi:DUF2208 family protein [Pyrobaculum neutrophilum]|uniref:DUF2208 domain-containing protein n=1 Tax=Pyrobaculum neutrophilum (strain DSM 2338 / JCM 9278 / NBRC 100436 / V24Sta) TaxID=444157 RepID=B1YCZ5_PYRNV|nr:DUF2208 family protein [Pyrobaculum neutrophilum]ACB39658.1 conserved hypothetical protein [Pyrobaculum neutrophilum V24Sta]
MRRVLISAVSILAFATILTFFPSDYFTAVLLYFVLFFAVSIFIGVRTYRRGIANVQEISRGKPLMEIDEKEVDKLLEKDKALMDEYRKFARASFMPLLILPGFILLATFLFPTLPHVAETSLGASIGPTAARFISYVAIFSVFSAISMLAFKPPVVPRIVRSLKVYEAGVVIDKTLGLKAPLEVSEYKINEERRFIEFKLNNQVFRIYHRDVKELDAVLSRLLRLKQ